ncbi:ubiquitin-conjugating enzyme/RWD-like protein [Limtongia smithiae]|uniref:ubiquitin-conjugating enzyme/RWD-like protein n=1 Tax=Limtongia smithiae TaxID=1125753 RepID=UPI0034CE6810
MATRAANKRLTREYMHMQESPPPFVVAHPSDKNILVWHYLITGPPATPYEGGQYHGTLTFPADYPYKPPAIRMATPSGRFQPNTRLCLSISDYHPRTWNPAWSVSTILTGLLSFMTSDELTTGALRSTETEKKALAAASHEWNLTQNRKFVEEFPEEAARNRATMAQRRVRAAAAAAAAATVPVSATSSPKSAPASPTSVQHHFPAPSSSKATAAAAVRPPQRVGIGRWMSAHKLMCACVAVLAWVVFARVRTGWTGV